jgi:Ca2+-binding RTX toxin-like protein
VATIVISGGSETAGGLNGIWGVNFILGFLADVNTVASGNASQATFSNTSTFGGPTTLVADGSFSNYNADGPQSGTVTGFTYTVYFTPGVPVTLTVTGISISVANLNNWVATFNTDALETALFGAADAITGTDFFDHIRGYGGGDTINAGGGADNAFGESGNDTVNGDAGNDYLDGGVGADVVNGGDGDDEVRGGDDADTVNGGAGNDRFDTLGAGDVFDGGDGFDTFSYSFTSATFTFDVDDIRGPAGVTLANGGTVRNMESFSIGSGGNNRTLTISGTLFGQNDVFMSGANDLLVLDFTTASESYSITPTSSNSYNIIGASGRISANSIERLQIVGLGGDTFYGGMSADTFNGGGGADTMFGNYHDDVLHGGDGNDTLWGEGDDDTMNGDAGADLLYGDWGVDTMNGGTGDDALWGEDDNDTLNGGDGADVLRGGAGADSISGGAGDDTLFGVTSDISTDTVGDAFNGGADFDTVTYAGAVAAVVADLVNAASNTGEATGDTYVSVEALIGTGHNDTLRGDDANNLLNGGGGDVNFLEGRGGADVLISDYGDDVLDGGAGADDMRGGNGDDSYVVDDAGDAITEDAGSGSDSVQSSVSHILSANVENLTLSGSAATGTGNGENNVITGNSGANTLSGLGGADTLNGGDGGDTLTGGAGVDVIDAGEGDDIIHYNFGDGVDSAINGRGGADVIVCQGNAGGETLDVAWNGSSFTAFKGSSVAGVEQASADMGGGVDWLRHSNSSVAVTINLATGAATGFISIANIENAWGTAFADTLTGSNVANIIRGGAGDDQIDGGADNDTLIGDDGADTILGGDGADNIFGASGADTINAGDGDDTINYSFGEGVDGIDGGTGTDTIICLGNSGAETLEVAWDGSSFTFFKGGAVTSIEQAVADMGVGGDWLRYTNSAVGVSIDLGLGTASGFVSIANVENAAGGAFNDTIIGSAIANNLLGNGGDDTIDGAGGNDTINAGAGADMITGGAGGDTMTGGADGDTFVFAAGSGGDSIGDFDANATGGQDLLDISAYGITSGNFASRVVITDQGVNTLVTIDGVSTILLSGVTGDGNNVVTQADFLLS